MLLPNLLRAQAALMCLALLFMFALAENARAQYTNEIPSEQAALLAPEIGRPRTPTPLAPKKGSGPNIYCKVNAVSRI